MSARASWQRLEVGSDSGCEIGSDSGCGFGCGFGFGCETGCGFGRETDSGSGSDSGPDFASVKLPLAGLRRCDLLLAGYPV